MEAGLPEQIKKGGFNGACLWAYKQVNDYHFDYRFIVLIWNSGSN
jgi:hypothetical protein